MFFSLTARANPLLNLPNVVALVGASLIRAPSVPATLAAEVAPTPRALVHVPLGLAVTAVLTFPVHRHNSPQKTTATLSWTARGQDRRMSITPHKLDVIFTASSATAHL